MGETLLGAPAAKAIKEDNMARSEALKAKGVTPCLAIVRVGERPDDLAYERGALKTCEASGVAVKQFLLPADVTQEDLLATITEINEDAAIHGCLMFRPLPDKAMENAACELLKPEKDVDSMTRGSLAAVFTQKGAGFAPCTAQAVMEILKFYGVDLTGKRVTVVGRSLVIGKPVSMMLQAANATVTMCHTKTVDLPSVTRNAEVLVACAGSAGMITKDHVSAGQVVIDVGINDDGNGGICGDVKFDEVEPIVACITPVPRGVGSVTTAVLAKHVVDAAEKTLA